MAGQWTRFEICLLCRAQRAMVWGIFTRLESARRYDSTGANVTVVSWTRADAASRMILWLELLREAQNVSDPSHLHFGFSRIGFPECDRLA